MTEDLYHEFERVLIPEEDIERRIRELAAEISEDYKDEGSIILVGVLKGSYMFFADLARRLTIPHYIDFIALSSYGQSGAVSGAVRLLLDLRLDIYNKHVLIIEDIVDSGKTLAYLYGSLQARKPASVKTCALVRKERDNQGSQIHYLGFEIPDVWVVGYGLDYAERHRTWPFIAELNAEGMKSD